MFRFVILIFLVVYINCQSPNEIVPSCDSIFGCISSVTCNVNEHWAPAASLDGCCPGCVAGLGLNEAGCDEQNVCAPGLVCAPAGVCLLNPADCLSTKHVPAKVAWKPTCDRRGQFEPKQCRGDLFLGRCFCYSATGQRIFGWDWRSKADKMTCSCSRQRSELEQAGRQDVTLHCTANGNYEELQCDDGLCWCAEPESGRPLPGVPVVIASMWKKLPCYNRTLHGDQYLRQCESAHFAQLLMQKKFHLRGHINVTHGVEVICDYDGSYGRYEIERGIAYCTWRDGKRLGQFQTSSLKLKQLTCNCARDQEIFTTSGVQSSLLCDGNGNYATLQDRNGELFCVDQDGFVVASDVTAEVDCTEYMFGGKLL